VHCEARGKLVRGADIEDFKSFLKEFQSETDRGAALVGASLIDQKLLDTLRAFLVEGKLTESLLEGGSAPVGTFSSIGMSSTSAKSSGKSAMSLLTGYTGQPLRTRKLRCGARRLNQICRVAVKASRTIPEGCSSMPSS
jgi:hypothetical protein